MKKSILFLIILLNSIKIFSQTSTNWDWEKNAKGNTLNQWEEGKSICTDENGFVYVAGVFYSDSITFENTTLVNFGFSDVFIVKYDSLGNIIWAKNAGGIGAEMIGTICIDNERNLFITGSSDSQIMKFGDTVKIISDSPCSRSYLAKYDSNGNAIWAKTQDIGCSWTSGIGLTVDTTGNIFVAGSFNYTLISGTDTLYNASPTTFPPKNDIFIIKYNSAGTLIWARGAGCNGYDLVNGIIADINGNIYLTGYADNGYITFGSASINGAWMSKYSTNGDILWAKPLSGARPKAITLDASNNIFITGSFNSLMYFPLSPYFYNSSTTAFGTTSDMFLVKYDDSGTYKWAKRTFGEGSECGNSVITDPNGNVYVTGYFDSSPTNFSSTAVTTIGSKDLFVTMYNPSGTEMWVKKAGGNLDDEASDIALGINKKEYITGSFVSSAIYFITDSLTHAANGLQNFFIAKLSDNITSLKIEENAANYSVIISPNPFASNTTINFFNAQNNTIINIIDVAGKTIKTINFSGKQLIIEKGVLKAGIYFVQIIDENKKVINKKIIIQ